MHSFSGLTLRRWACGLLLCFGMLVSWVRPVLAQTDIQITDRPAPDYVFGDRPPTFQLSATSAAPITEVTLYLRTPDDPHTFVGKASFTQGTTVHAIYTLEAAARSLPAFSPVEYWWEVHDKAGRQIVTDPQSFTYVDNRFEWQALSQAPLTVHWYEGDHALAQAVLDTAVNSLNQANRLIVAPLPKAINIYLYSSAGAARAAIAPYNHLWVDSQANPPLNAIIVTLPPGAADTPTQIERKIPHELTHLILYARAPEQFARLPNWVNEGLAVFNQASVDNDYAALIAAARGTNALLPLETLCGPFPGDPNQARLAYAQSESLIRYIRDQFGETALQKLMAAYADGLNCSAGVERALNLPLTELERRWQARTLSAPVTTGPLAAWLPWGVLGLLVLLAPIVFALAARPAKADKRVI